MYASNRLVAESLKWDGLNDYVRCVPEAALHARKASNDGQAAIVLTALGVSFGVASLGGFAGFAVDNGKYLGAFLGTGVGVAVVGTIIAGLSRLFKNRANGQAVDAMNYYNDSVGSLGATCADLTYPPPAGPAPAAPPAPTPETTPQGTTPGDTAEPDSPPNTEDDSAEDGPP